KKSDLDNPEGSPVFNAMLNHKSKVIRSDAQLLLRMLWASPELIPELSASEEEIETLPRVNTIPQVEEQVEREELFFISRTDEESESSSAKENASRRISQEFTTNRFSVLDEHDFIDDDEANRKKVRSAKHLAMSAKNFSGQSIGVFMRSSDRFMRTFATP